MTEEMEKYFDPKEPIYLERSDGILTVVHSKSYKKEELFRYAEEASKVIKEEIRVIHNGQTLFKDGKPYIDFGTT